ncbi:thiamine phosphate synthase [Mesobacillus zeae]|uniref:Thiamine-phosphate synthase n=1 Tax=Mesobacillus zeae TaxID=1917180 RepID=A0A398AXF8_9BACI|nr:thiamine phosphate synthase [Mesobacillus zeae]RID82275.1 thiamine phosphate synthase [Mesobacillus zeae]
MEDKLREMLKLYFIMGSNNCRKDPETVLKEAIKGGITLFQFREKGQGSLGGCEKKQLAVNLQRICKEAGIPFIVNDDIELALEVDADGVHIGQSDMSAGEARCLVGSKILGVSVHTLKEAEQAREMGADYFGVGPVFHTTTKEDALPASGVSFIRELRKNGYSIPIVGIGGITAENAGDVMSSGVDGVSVISFISNAESPKKAAMGLKENIMHKQNG